MTDEELLEMEKKSKKARLNDILENREDEAIKYFEKIQTPAKMITQKSLRKHIKLIEKKDPIAIFLDSVCKEYRIDLKLLQSSVNSREDVVFNVECPVCGTPLKHTSCFAKTCSKKCGAVYAQISIRKTNLEKYGVSCSWKSDKVKDRIRLTNLEKYGVESPMQSDEVKERMKATFLEKYGVENPGQIEEVKARVKATNLERYGVEYTFSSEKIKQEIRETNTRKYGVAYYTSTDEFKSKSRETFLEKYGVEHPSQADEVKERMKATFLEKYGVENPGQSEEVQAKVHRTNLEKYGNEIFVKSETFKSRAKATNLEKYGTEFASRSEKSKEKTKKTNTEKYGTPYSSQSEIVKKKVRRTNREKTYDFFMLLLESRDLEALDDRDTILTSGNINIRCLVCGEKFESQYDAATYQSAVFCPNCHPKYNSPETEIYSFLEQFIPNTEILRKNRKILKDRKELDLYIPTKKLAIEFDGLYWHNTSRYGKLYHLGKTEECQDQGIRLCHILEHEWKFKSEIVKSILLAKLNIFSETIYARKSKIKTLTNSEYRIFLLKNHIQGYAPAATKIGLIYNGEIVACVGIGKSRFKKGEMELIRFCTKLNTRVIGGLSKLIKHANLNTDLVSYVDRRYFDGSGYIKAGFVEIGKTSPGYVYCKRDETLSRYQCQKHKLKKILGEKFNEELTEKQNMELAGYHQVYDCGMIKMIKRGEN